MAAIPVKIKMLSDKAITPKRATVGSVAYDVCVPEDTIIRRGRQVIPLQFAIELPDKCHEAKIEPRSGFSSKGMEGYALYHKSEPTFDSRLIGGVGIKDVEYIAAQPDRFDADVLTGKIDSDFRNSVGVIINSHEERDFLVKAGTRIAQMTIYKVPETVFVAVSELSETDRKGGFGHTGTK